MLHKKDLQRYIYISIELYKVNRSNGFQQGKYLTVHEKNHRILSEHVVRYEMHINRTEAGEMYFYELSIWIATITNYVVDTKKDRGIKIKFNT